MVDPFTLIFQGFFLVAALVVLLISYRYLRDGGFYQGEYYFLLLTAFLGCTLMPASRNLLMLFLALELVSAPGFLMAAFRKSDIKGERGRAEVLHHRGAVDRGDALRDEPDLRAHRRGSSCTRSREALVG